MSMSKRAWVEHFARHTDDQLRAAFDDLTNDRVKTGRRKGIVKVRAAKYGDRILDELKRRRGKEEQ